MDELLFVGLAPRRAHLIAANTVAAADREVPKRPAWVNRLIGFCEFNWKGLDLHSAFSMVFVVISLALALAAWVEPQISTLKHVEKAICAGDVYFVYVTRPR